MKAIPSAPPQTPRAVLTLRGIRKAYPGVVALDGVDLELRAGEVHVLLGENGAGKSTLMKIISGAVARDAGEVLLDGAPVEIRGPRHAQALGLGIIYQEFNLIPHLTALKTIANESLAHDTAWRFLMLGRHLERGQQLLFLTRHLLGRAEPLHRIVARPLPFHRGKVICAHAERPETYHRRRGDILFQANRLTEARRAYTDALAAIDRLPDWLRLSEPTQQLIAQLTPLTTSPL